ncbi:MAG: protein-L-isoaspartate(D-aspartate) O-methyltransferase [Rhodospirillaceae bacterium]|jgi:protein-L-isoaspartate(D-aspartate) O-methyltransferase|nr:protein-L-isoaspartate(D-aspartate) O-methyltransferase [Rhodospirillaceae bacterium]
MADTRKIRLILELRGAGIADSRILAAIERVPRETFVPETFRDQAYANTALPIGHGVTISEPRVVATMTQALELGDRMKVLEIGTGSGYQAAVLSHLCRRVYTIERNRELLREAMERFTALRLHNVTTRPGDGMRGWPEQAPFERIIVTAAGVETPKDLLDQLAVGGIMVLPLGPDGRTQTLYRLRRTEEGIDEESLGPVRFVPLRGGVDEAASSA